MTTPNPTPCPRCCTCSDRSLALARALAVLPPDVLELFRQIGRAADPDEPETMLVFCHGCGVRRLFTGGPSTFYCTWCGQRLDI